MLAARASYSAVQAATGCSRATGVVRLIVAAFFAAAIIETALAQEFPSRSITIVVPYPAGGAMDAVGRIVANELQKKFQQNVVVDNRVGGNGVVGMNFVAKAPADGYTLMITSEVGQAVLPALDPAFNLDVMKIFQPLSLAGQFSHFVIVRSALGVNSLPELIDKARANPGKLNYGSNGLGTISHVAMEMIKKRANIDIVHVPYRGSTAALSDLLGGTLDTNLQSLPVLMSQIDNPAIKVLATLSATRDPRLPNVPTLVESGFAGLTFSSWTAVFAPAGLPPQVADKISAALAEAINTPEVRERFRSIGFEPVGSDAQTLDAFQHKVAETWKNVATETGITIGQ
jgi:tripartite-type tricarboxylate transporter receptor subunit TctC